MMAQGPRVALCRKKGTILPAPSPWPWAPGYGRYINSSIIISFFIIIVVAWGLALGLAPGSIVPFSLHNVGPWALLLGP